MGDAPFSLNPADLLTICLGIPPERHTKHQRKLGETVRELGYEKKRFSIGGSKLNRYYKGTGLNPVHLTTAQIKDMADTHSRMWPRD